MALAPLRNHACMTSTTRGRMCYASVGELDTLVNDDSRVRAHADHSQEYGEHGQVQGRMGPASRHLVGHEGRQANSQPMAVF